MMDVGLYCRHGKKRRCRDCKRREVGMVRSESVVVVKGGDVYCIAIEIRWDLGMVRRRYVGMAR